jgi:hypothetical protein
VSWPAVPRQALCLYKLRARLESMLRHNEISQREIDLLTLICDVNMAIRRALH